MWALSSYVALGRSILQPHQLVEEMTLQRHAADIKATAFGKLIENCQVIGLLIRSPRFGRISYKGSVYTSGAVFKCKLGNGLSARDINSNSKFQPSW